MKRIMYALILPLVVVTGLSKPLSGLDRKAKRDDKKTWEASADGIKYKKWEVSPEGKKVRSSADKIRSDISAFTGMEAMVTSLSLPLRKNGKPSGFEGILVDINGETYMVQFGAANNNPDYKQLHSLKVNDKIVIRSRYAGYSPNYPYLLISGDLIEHNGKTIFKRKFPKGGC
ncbi:hypothetical protein ACXZ1K_01180 [Pedobacter sp. PWIIR3]